MIGGYFRRKFGCTWTLFVSGHLWLRGDGGNRPGGDLRGLFAARLLSESARARRFRRRPARMAAWCAEHTLGFRQGITNCMRDRKRGHAASDPPHWSTWCRGAVSSLSRALEPWLGVVCCGTFVTSRQAPPLTAKENCGRLPCAEGCDATETVPWFRLFRRMLTGDRGDFCYGGRCGLFLSGILSSLPETISRT